MVKAFKFISVLVGILGLLFITTTITSHAQNSISQDGKSYALGGSVYNQTIYRAGDLINIYDVINGDLYCLGNNINIDATIDGDIICAGNDITIKGKVSGDIRLIADTATIYADIKNNATIVASNINIKKEARVNGDLTALAQNVSISGQISRDAYIRADSVDMYGKVGRNLKSYHSNLTFNGDAKVGGDFIYASADKVFIPKDSIKGDIIQEPLRASSRLSGVLTSTVFLAMLAYIAWFISLLIAAIGVAILFPKSLEDSVKYATKQPLVSMFVGVMALFFVPILLVMLLFSIIGIPLAMILWFMYGTILLLSTPFVAHLIGALLLPNRSHPIKALVGASILLLIYAIPIINILAFMIVTALGSGLVIRVLTERYSVARRQYQQKA
jgi:cytoskeletal protein CcmA (bactofilin family)